MFSSYSGISKNLAVKFNFQSKLIVHCKIFPSEHIKACVIFIKINICGSCNLAVIFLSY